MSPAPPPLVLVVDDYPDAREMYAEYLVACGFRVTEACNGFEAVSHAGAMRPDVILMDLSLPGMDGFEATRRLKANKQTRHIPIVAITGRSGPAASESARTAGCAAFVQKPALPEEVAAEVRKVLGRRTRRRRSERA